MTPPLIFINTYAIKEGRTGDYEKADCTNEESGQRGLDGTVWAAQLTCSSLGLGVWSRGRKP
jgi:hypothetical protein